MLNLQPAAGQGVGSYANVQYPPQVVAVQSEQRTVPVAQRTIPTYSDAVPVSSVTSFVRCHL